MSEPAPGNAVRSQSVGGDSLTGSPPAIELKSINKSFGAVRANKDVHLFVKPGTIHGIVGENGAGKSTLMSILYGFYEADSGDIFVAGEKVRINSSQAAIRAGIGMVHQHFMLVDTFTVLENVMLGAEASSLIGKSATEAAAKLKHLADNYGLHIDINAITGELPVGKQQRVEILKTLYRGAQVLILDEPTGVLTPQEADRLFQILKALKEEGVTIVLITHKLREIIEITDNVSVMRQGQMIAHRTTAQTNKEELAELMVGRKVFDNASRGAENVSEAAVTAEHLTILGPLGLPQVEGVSFQIRSGEIVGLAGVSGNGQSELLDALSGIRPIDKGRITLNGREITPVQPFDPGEARILKVAHVPEDRHRMGLLTKFQARESMILGYHRQPFFNRGWLLDQQVINDDCLRLMNAFDVRPREPNIKSANMSGGNQQKLILAREIDKTPQVLFVGQPTRGVDIGAIEFIHEYLLGLRDNGCAILMVSVELDEIMKLSDRILVMFEGRIVGELDRQDANPKHLGLMMANAHDTSATKGQLA